MSKWTAAKKLLYVTGDYTWKSFLLVVLSLAFNLVVNSQRPTSYWLEYDYDGLELSPLHRGQYFIGDQLQFKSTFIQRTFLSIGYKDELECEYTDGTREIIVDEGRRVFKSPRIAGYAIPPDEFEHDWEWLSGLWNWPLKRPDKPGKCRLHGRPVFLPPPFIAPPLSELRRVEVDTDWFDVVERENVN